VTKLLLLLAEFVALSLPLTWLWIHGGKALYVGLLFSALDPLYPLLLGVPHGGRGAGGVSLRYVSQIPFLVLMAITPAMALRRRLLGWLFGALVIFASHLALVLFTEAAASSGRRVGVTVLPAILLVDGLPLLIWIVLARDFLRGVVPGLRDREGAPPS
jgi:hypothetical protein